MNRETPIAGAGEGLDGRGDVFGERGRSELAPPSPALTPARARHSRRRFGGASAGLATALTLAILWSCSVDKNYKILSFIFDGVPNPADKAKATGPGAAKNLRDSPTYSIHKPFADERCMECHSKSFELGTQDSSLCMKCHADKTTQYPKMHGPVSAVACLWCHAPHESAEAHLLKKPPRDVCSQCHEQGMLNVERVPAHADPARACTECHSGHGGTASYFLLPAVRSQPAAPAPAAKPPSEPAPAAPPPPAPSTDAPSAPEPAPR